MACGGNRKAACKPSELGPPSAKRRPIASN